MNGSKERLINNFKSLRVKSGLLQEDVAKLLGTSRSRFSVYENNPWTMKLSTLFKLCFIYRCDLNNFFIDVDVSNCLGFHNGIDYEECCKYYNKYIINTANTDCISEGVENNEKSYDDDEF